MKSELSMATRAENTTKYAKQYKKATRKTKVAMVDGVVAATGCLVTTTYGGSPGPRSTYQGPATSEKTPAQAPVPRNIHTTRSISYACG